MNKVSKNDWRSFEELILQILLDEYNIQESKINKLTSETNDGGYDGIFYVPFGSNENDTPDRMLKMLFEAKLRSDINNDLKLQEFSKALIIAINKNADRIVIATNLHFSSNTRKVLQQYAVNTGLSIQLKTSIDIFSWIENHSESICGKSAKDSLYNLLKESNDVESRLYKNKDSINIINDIEKPTIPVLYGDKRNKEKDRAKQCIKEHYGILTIEGEAGVGKSVFLNNLLSELKSDGFKSYVFDLQTFSTPRTLFIDMVCKIWSISYDALFTKDKTELESVLCYLGEELIDRDMNQSISEVLSGSKEKYYSHEDIYEFYLINYIFKLYTMRNQKHRIIISFTNINYATEELSMFVLSLCRKMGKDLSILLEIRTSDSVYNNAWSEVSKQILMLPNIQHRCEIRAFSNSEALIYICEQFKPYDIDCNTCTNVFKKIGNNPLYLAAYIECIKYRLTAGEVLLQNINAYIIHQEIDNFNSILTDYILSVVGRSEHNAKICFVLAVTHGKVRIDILKDLLGQKCMKHISAFLKDAKFVIVKDDALIITHGLFVDSLRTYIDRLPLLVQQNLSTDLLRINSLYIPYASQNIETKIELLKILNKTSELIEECVSYATTLFSQGQYNKSYKFYDLAYNSLFDLSETDFVPNDIEYNCRLGHLDTMLKLNLFENPNISFLAEIEQCKLFLKLKFSEHIPDEEIRLYLTEYRYYHCLGDFKQSLKTAEKMMKIVQNNVIVSQDLAPKVLSEYCIAVKETSSLSCALKEYSKATKKYPYSVELRFSRLTHLVSKYSTTSPRAAMRLLKFCSDLEPELSMSDRFHNRVNILACLFLYKKYEAAEAYGKELINDLFVFGLRAEEGRAANNLGCVYWAMGNTNEAKKIFEYGISKYKEGKYAAFLWPVLINRISLSLISEDDCDEEYADRCFAIFINDYRDRISHFTFAEDYYDKLFVGIAVLCLYYIKHQKRHKVEEFNEKMSHTPLNNILVKINSYKELVDVLKNTLYVHNNAIMVKS